MMMMMMIMTIRSLTALHKNMVLTAPAVSQLFVQ